jgi:hypothetical protein
LARTNAAESVAEIRSIAAALLHESQQALAAPLTDALQELAVVDASAVGVLMQRTLSSASEFHFM